MNAAQMVVHMARVGRNIHQAGVAWGNFRKADDGSVAKRELKDTRLALEAALRCLDRMEPTEKVAARAKVGA